MVKKSGGMGGVAPLVLMGGGLAALYFLTKPSASTVNALAAKAAPIAKAQVSAGASIAAAAAGAAAAVVNALKGSATKAVAPVVAPPSTPTYVAPTEGEPGESSYAYSVDTAAD